MLITVIISVYNDEQNIKTAIHSVLNQTYQNWELIIINDGSFDNTIDKIEEFRYINKIKIINQQKNMGTYFCYNIALTMSKGDFFCVLGSDDTFHPQKLEIQLNYLFINPNIPCVGCQYTRNNNLITVDDKEATYLYQKNIIDKIGYFDTVRFSSDSEFIYRIYKVYGKNNVHIINQILYYAIKRQKSLTTDNKTKLGSNIRKQYVQNFMKWHNDINNLYMPFPLLERPFPINNIMQP